MFAILMPHCKGRGIVPITNASPITTVFFHQAIFTEMSPYITFKDRDKEGSLQLYILQREEPSFVGIITDRYNNNSLACVNITGYRLWVKWGGTLRGNYFPSYFKPEEIKEVFQKMADWYLESRITGDEKRFKKWKL